MISIAVGQWERRPWGNGMWCLGATIDNASACNALGQLQPLPWGNGMQCLKFRELLLLPWVNCSWCRWAVVCYVLALGACYGLALGAMTCNTLIGTILCTSWGNGTWCIDWSSWICCCNGMWWRGATCDTFLQWQVMPRGNIMWCLGTNTTGALRQWHVMPWGNPGSWHRGAMPGDSPVGWFFRNPNRWFGAQSAKWQKKTFTCKKIYLNWATLELYA